MQGLAETARCLSILPSFFPSQELVEYYQSHSLKESFKQLDTTLKYPYKSRERSTSRTFTRSPGKTQLGGQGKPTPSSQLERRSSRQAKHSLSCQGRSCLPSSHNHFLGTENGKRNQHLSFCL